MSWTNSGYVPVSYGTNTGGGGSASWHPVTPGETWAGQRTSGSAYVTGAGRACREGGCRAEELEAMLSSTLNVAQECVARREEEAKRLEPTRALWCEQGGHSFSEKDPGFQVLSITGKDNEGKQVTESRTICGPCADKTKTTLGSARNAPSAELTDGE